MLRRAITRFSPSYLKTLVYMLQASGYEAKSYVKWLGRVEDFRYRRVARRGKLDWTIKAKAVWLVGFWMWLVGLLGAWVVVMWEYFYLFEEVALGSELARVVVAAGSFMAVMLVVNWAIGYLIVVPLILGKMLVQRPIEKRRVREAREKLAGHAGKKIAVVGSYGKTTAKEVIATVLGAGMKVAATKGNINQPLGLAEFVMGLDGDEDVLVLEMGEYRAGDIGEMCEWVRPDMGIITGVNEAHLESFGTKEVIVETLMGLKDFLGEKGVYLNGDCEELRGLARVEDVVYCGEGVGDWKTSGVKSGVEGTSFVMKRGKKKLDVGVELLGEHLVGVVAAAVHLAMELGLSEGKIKEGLARVVPFEHRMRPRMVNGAVVIDDTYNGNIDGVRAGISLLKRLEGERKIYVTPGLVEQGAEAERVHMEIGEMLASGVDEVVLMRNSVTGWIEEGLEKGGFRGELKIVENPVEYYLDLEQYLAAGMVVMMQNDWPDNYV